MPTKKAIPSEDAPKKAVPQKAAVKKAAPKKAAPKKVTPPAEPVESIMPPAEPIESPILPVEPAVPAAVAAEESVVAAPAPVVAAEPVVPAPAPVPPAPVMPYVPPRPFPSGTGKPGMVQAIAIMTLVNGILNILYGLGVTAAIVLGTFFVGIICAPVTILPVVLGIFEILYAVKLMANPPQPVKPSQTIAILEIIAILSGNVISAVVGILVLVFYADANVKAYFAKINGQA